MNSAWTSAWTLAAAIVFSPPTFSDPPTSQSAETSLADKLSSVRVSLHFEDAPFVDVIEHLRKAGGVNIAVDPRVFAETRPDYLNVSTKIDDVPLGSALNILLRPRGLAVQEAGAALLVVPRGVQERDVYFVMYDVRDLLVRVADFPAPELPISFASQWYAGG